MKYEDDFGKEKTLTTNSSDHSQQQILKEVVVEDYLPDGAQNEEELEVDKNGGGQEIDQAQN